VAIDFLFERIEDAHPRVRDDGGCDTDIFLKKTRDAGEGAPGRNPI